MLQNLRLKHLKMHVSFHAILEREKKKNNYYIET
jgi:hypothetical protein